VDVLASVKSLVFQRTALGIGSRAVRHLVAGGIGTILYLASVSFLVEVFGLNPVLSVIIAILIFEIYTYLSYWIWVYQPNREHNYVIPRFLFITFLALFLNTAIMHLTVNIMALWYVWGLVATTLIVPPTNFLLNFYWAFK